MFLVLDRLPVHRSAEVRAWLAGRGAEIELFYLPGYSSELNPDEGVNGDLKQAGTRKGPARGKAQLKRAVVGHMRRLPKSPDRVRSFFGHKTFRYAAQFKIIQAGSVIHLRRATAVLTILEAAQAERTVHLGPSSLARALTDPNEVTVPWAERHHRACAPA